MLAVQGFTGQDWRNLQESCEAAVKERAAHPLLGLKTLGDLCGRQSFLLPANGSVLDPAAQKQVYAL